MRCKGTTSRGGRCQKPSVIGEYCINHAPAGSGAAGSDELAEALEARADIPSIAKQAMRIASSVRLGMLEPPAAQAATSALKLALACALHAPKQSASSDPLSERAAAARSAAELDVDRLLAEADTDDDVDDQGQDGADAA